MTKPLPSAFAALVILSAGSAAFANEFETVDGIRQYGPAAQVLVTKPVSHKAVQTVAPVIDQAAGTSGFGN